jgi:hypothetical protein
LKNSKGGFIQGYPIFPYKLVNELYSISFDCTVDSNQIKYCSKKSEITLPQDISLIPLNFTDGNVTIKTIECLIYKRNAIIQIFPKASLINETMDVLVTFNTSTFNHSLINTQLYCLDKLNKFMGVVVNVTTIKCLSVNSMESKTFLFDVVIVKEEFNASLNDNAFKYFVISISILFLTK